MFLINIIKIFVITIISVIFLQYFILIIEKFVESKTDNKTIYKFLISVFRYLFYLILSTIVLDSLNVKISSLITILGTIGITIGLSLKNSLSNLSSGILIILLNIFKIGDKIKIEKVSGIVSDIKILTTILRTENNESIIIPNNKFLSSNVINLSKNKFIDINIQIPNNSNYLKNKKYIIKILNNLCKKKIINKFVLKINNINISIIDITINIYTNLKTPINIKSNILEKFLNIYK